MLYRLISDPWKENGDADLAMSKQFMYSCRETEEMDGGDTWRGDRRRRYMEERDGIGRWRKDDGERREEREVLVTCTVVEY